MFFFFTIKACFCTLSNLNQFGILMRNILPKFWSRVPKFLKKWKKVWLRASMLYYTIPFIVLTLVASHLLITHRQPVRAASILFEPRYWIWLFLGFALLLLLQRACYWIIQYIYDLKVDEKMQPFAFSLKLCLLIFTMVLLIPGAIEQLMVFVFHAFGLDFDESGYVDHEFVWICIGLWIYSLCVLWILEYREKRRFKVLSAIRLKHYRILEVQLKIRGFEEYIKENFILIRKKGNPYVLTDSGKLRKDQYKTGELAEVLETSYVEVNRGTHIAKAAILSWNIETGIVVLHPTFQTIFERALKREAQLREWHEQVKGSPYGLLTLNKSYFEEIKRKIG